MSMIRRAIQVGFDLRVFFTRNVFGQANPLLRDVLAGAETGRTHGVLVVMDEALPGSQPSLTGQFEAFFANASRRLKLVCEPMIIEGGERTKNSYFHVS